jgi:hypothetical protein
VRTAPQRVREVDRSTESAISRSDDDDVERPYVIAHPPVADQPTGSTNIKHSTNHGDVPQAGQARTGTAGAGWKDTGRLQTWYLICGSPVCANTASRTLKGAPSWMSNASARRAGTVKG